jgi:putative thioredoxin
VAEAQARQVIDEVLRVAAANGVTGTVDADASNAEPQPEAPVVDPPYAEAQSALDRGDIEAAVTAFRSILEARPGDPEATAAVARCELLQRTQGAEEESARRAAADRPDDVDAQVAVADLDMLRGSVEDAVARLVDLIRRTSDADRDRARQHLLKLFEVLDPEDPRLANGRRALANALF